jgi:hypothetical protein
MKTTIITGRDNGNGSKNEIARLMPNDIPIHNNCWDKNCLLLPITISQVYNYETLYIKCFP